MDYYIYRYFNKKNKVIYVGLTSRPLKKRVKEHQIELLQTDTDHIDFARVQSEADMRMYELYYINKYRPKYNKRDLYFDGHNLSLPELVFEPYLEESSRNDYYASVEQRNYVFNCPGGQVSLSVLNPYDKRPEKMSVSVTGHPTLSKRNMQEFIKLIMTVYDDLSFPVEEKAKAADKKCVKNIT